MAESASASSATQIDFRNLDAAYIRQHAALRSRALRIVGDLPAAEDVLQECYLRSRSAIAKGDVENIAAFLHRVTRNLALDHLRRSKVRARMEICHAQDDCSLAAICNRPTAEAIIIGKQQILLCREALDRLPLRARRIFVLSRFANWPYPQIAAHLGVSPGTVFNDMKLANETLKALLRRQ